MIRMTTSKNNIDFVELCGSELAASSLNDHVVGRQVALKKKFVTQSFNSLSCALISSAIDQTMNKEQHSVLTKVLSTTLFAP